MITLKPLLTTTIACMTTAAAAVCFQLVNLSDACVMAPCAVSCGSISSEGEEVTTSASLPNGGRSRVAKDFLCIQHYYVLDGFGVCNLQRSCQTEVGGYVLSGLICPDGPPA